MIVRFDGGQLTISGQTAAERDMLQLWTTTAQDHLFSLAAHGTDTLALFDAGPTADVRCEPINITFDSTPMPLQLISNLAETPFMLDGQWFASVEGFWQGLKFADDQARRTIAGLAGPRAKAAGRAAPASDVIVYGGRNVRVGTVDHWTLMERANHAKFEQHRPARMALLSTGSRPLQHRVARDSQTIPGVIMADVWMRARAHFAAHG